MGISGEVVSQVAHRIAEHVREHRLGSVEVVLHGGEPLLAGVDGLRRVITTLTGALRDVCRVDLRVHTNGVLLDERFCELFAEHGVGVGISIDGDRAANDRHRRYRDGRSSYDQVVRAVRLVSTDRYRHLYAGLLCTIDIANDPIAVYDALIALRPPRIDFLLPHATWDNPPPGRGPSSGGQYAEWLIAIFDRWQVGDYPVQIRTFDSVISTLAGGESLTEALGHGPASLVVIETDGSYEQADSLKVAFDGAPATGLNVFEHSLDRLGQHAGIAVRQLGLAGLCRTCRECPVVGSCGGGLYAHRYRSANGFDNPSVYCDDLLRLITHVRGRLPHLAAGRPATANHAMSDRAFRELAVGLGGADAIAQLAEAQRTLQRSLLAGVYQSGVNAPFVGEAARMRLRAAWKVITGADGRHPEAVDTVLGHPYLRAWAVSCLERLRRAAGAHANQAPPTGGARSTPDATVPGLDTDLDHLGAVAAAIAVHCGTDAVLAAPVIEGAVHLPGLGRLVLPTATARASGLAALVIGRDAVGVRAGEGSWKLTRSELLAGDDLLIADSGAGAEDIDYAEWQPVRMLAAPGIRVALEDTDPYRDCHQWRAAPRLADIEFKRWQQDFEAAWREIRTNHAAYAPAIAAGLHALMPMSAGPPGHDVSAAARHAFGAIGTARPEDPAILALLIIHEFQHVKLGAILSLKLASVPRRCRMAATGIPTIQDFSQILPEMTMIMLKRFRKDAPAHPPAGPVVPRPRLRRAEPEDSGGVQ